MAVIIVIGSGHGLRIEVHDRNQADKSCTLRAWRNFEDNWCVGLMGIHCLQVITNMKILVTPVMHFYTHE